MAGYLMRARTGRALILRRLVVARLALFREVSRDTPDVTQCGGLLG
jgi:hypothetical protein